MKCFDVLLKHTLHITALTDTDKYKKNLEHLNIFKHVP